MDQGGDARQLEQRAVVPAPVVLAPRHLARVELEVRAADVVVLRNKVSRGGFSAVFLLQCLKAMGVRSLSLED